MVKELTLTEASQGEALHKRRETQSPVFVDVTKTGETYVYSGEGDPVLWEQ